MQSAFKAQIRNIKIEHTQEENAFNVKEDAELDTTIPDI